MKQIISWLLAITIINHRKQGHAHFTVQGCYMEIMNE